RRLHPAARARGARPLRAGPDVRDDRGRLALDRRGAARARERAHQGLPAGSRCSVRRHRMNHRRVAANDIELHVAEQGEGRPVILCHGFPELWYSWRHQLPALADAGYRAVAPDMRGYGESSIPEAIEAYDVLTLGEDLLGLL